MSSSQLLYDSEGVGSQLSLSPVILLAMLSCREVLSQRLRAVSVLEQMTRYVRTSETDPLLTKHLLICKKCRYKCDPRDSILEEPAKKHTTPFVWLCKLPHNVFAGRSR